MRPPGDHLPVSPRAGDKNLFVIFLQKQSRAGQGGRMRVVPPPGHRGCRFADIGADSDEINMKMLRDFLGP